MRKLAKDFFWLLRIVAGGAIYALGFTLFLSPHGFNAGGIIGLAQILVKGLGFGSVGMITALINLPLFILGGWKLGRKFFVGSLAGTVSSVLGLELFSLLPVPETEPLLAVLYGGALCGLGLGSVFVVGASTGGSDIIVRLLKLTWQNVPIGTITMSFDISVMILTGLAAADLSAALYTGLAVFLSGKVIDLVVYSFDYSEVVLVISDAYEQITEAIHRRLNRGVTYLNGEGAYAHQNKKVILTAVKRHQLADVKRLVSQIDPQAFVIVQEAHQVLGDGFARYSKESL